MEYRLKSGAVISDEDIAEVGRRIECGELPGEGWRGEIVRGRPRLSDEPLDTITFKMPHSAALRVARAAEACGKSRSSFLREAAMEHAEKTLAGID